MSQAEREKYVAWWLYESGLEVDELLEIALALSALGLATHDSAANRE